VVAEAEVHEIIDRSPARGTQFDVPLCFACSTSTCPGVARDVQVNQSVGAEIRFVRNAALRRTRLVFHPQAETQASYDGPTELSPDRLAGREADPASFLICMGPYAGHRAIRRAAARAEQPGCKTDVGGDFEAELDLCTPYASAGIIHENYRAAA
jgi:hypothetical protein